MKKLFLIRHSKAIDDAPSDFERKLTFDGKNLARLVAQKLNTTPGINSKLISSPALRAYETAKEFARQFGLRPEMIEKNDFLYTRFSIENFLLFLDSIDNNHSELWIFGHNPMLSEIISYLSDGKILSMPKCAVAALQTDANNWVEVSPTISKLLFFENPKNYK